MILVVLPVATLLSLYFHLQVNPLFGTIYNSIYLLAKSIHNAKKAGMLLSGSNMAYFTKNITFNGFNQKVKVDTSGTVKTSYIILDTDNRGSQLYQTYLVDLTSGVLRFAGRSIHFPGRSPPPSDSSCWFDEGTVCTGGMRIKCTYCHLSITLLYPTIILRCGDHLHHDSVSRHPLPGCRRPHNKSLYQVNMQNLF